MPPKTGRRPVASRVKMRISRSAISRAMSWNGIGPVAAQGAGTPKVGAERRAELAQRLDQQEARREPDRPAPVRVAPLELRRSPRPARSRRPGRRTRTGAARAPSRGCGCRSRRGTRPGRRSAAVSRRSWSWFEDRQDVRHLAVVLDRVDDVARPGRGGSSGTSRSSPGTP